LRWRLRGDLGLAVTLEGGGEHGGVLGEAGRLAEIALPGDCVLLLDKEADSLAYSMADYLKEEQFRATQSIY